MRSTGRRSLRPSKRQSSKRLSALPTMTATQLHIDRERCPTTRPSSWGLPRFHAPPRLTGPPASAFQKHSRATSACLRLPEARSSWVIGSKHARAGTACSVMFAATRSPASSSNEFCRVRVRGVGITFHWIRHIERGWLMLLRLLSRVVECHSARPVPWPA